MAKAAAFRRSAWLPVVEDGDGDAAASKFSGAPHLAGGEAWPACGNCGRPMQLFVQLNARDLPAAGRARLGEEMLLQFFYCTSDDPLCEDDCDAWQPHAASTLLRLVAAPEGSRGDRGTEIPAAMFPAKRITGWTEAADYPLWDEYEELGMEMSDAEADVLGDAFPVPARSCWDGRSGCSPRAIPRAASAARGWSTSSRSIPSGTCRTCSATWAWATSRSARGTRRSWRSAGRATDRGRSSKTAGLAAPGARRPRFS